MCIRDRNDSAKDLNKGRCLLQWLTANQNPHSNHDHPRVSVSDLNIESIWLQVEKKKKKWNRVKSETVIAQKGTKGTRSWNQTYIEIAPETSSNFHTVFQKKVEILIKNDFLKDKQANICLENGVMMMPKRRLSKLKCMDKIHVQTLVLAMYMPAVRSLCLACCTLYTWRISPPPNSTSLSAWQCSKKSTGKLTVVDFVLVLEAFFFLVGLTKLRGLTEKKKKRSR